MDLNFYFKHASNSIIIEDRHTVLKNICCTLKHDMSNIITIVIPEHCLKLIT